MTAPSYDGPEVVGECTECGYRCMVPDPEAFPPPDDKKGHCPRCKRLTVWDRETWADTPTVLRPADE